MVLHCAIHLSRDPPVYTPGDMVEGVLVLTSTYADKIHGISVKLVKKLEVEWDSYRLYDKTRVSSIEDVSFLSECEILNCPTPSHSNSPSPTPSTCQTPSPSKSFTPSNFAIVPITSLPPSQNPSGTSSSSGPFTNFTSKRGLVITRGVQHRYPFLLKIAYELDLPASFNGTYGYIAYKIICFIRAPKKGIYIGTLKDICIFPILDLNHLDHKLQRPVHEKRVFKSLFGYNYVFMKCGIEKRAFTPDEAVSFTVEITNKSPAPLEGVEVNLNMATQYSIYGASKIENLTLLRIRGPCIGQGEHAIWAHSFNFPSCSFPTGFGQLSRMRSKSIDLQYTLLFSLEVSKAEKFMIPFKIVIGTVGFGQLAGSSRVLCINQHLSGSLEALQLQGACGGVEPVAEPITSTVPPPAIAGTSKSFGYPQMKPEPRSGGSATGSGASGNTSGSSGGEGAGSSTSCGSASGGESSRANQNHERTPNTEVRSSSRCSGGFCCAVRGHQPKCRPRSKSTSALPPSYSAANLYYQCIMLRRAETPPPTYYEARRMKAGGHSNAVTP